MHRQNPQRIAFLNFGGIGDEILFSPVIQAVCQAYPDAHLTLILEKRSRCIQELVLQLDGCIAVELQQRSKIQLFGHLLKQLQEGRFDAVISSGSSPFISVLLALSGIPVRIGFDTGLFSRMLLTEAAPLNRKTYAGEMYFALARTFLHAVKKPYQSKEPIIPKLSVEPAVREQARQLLARYEPSPPRQRILIHPGVSHISVRKNILKAWPTRYWAELLAELPRRYPEANIYLLGGPDDAEAIEQLEAYCEQLPGFCRSRMINLYGKTANLQELAGLIDLADLLISVDSAPMHLAVGFQTPVVAVFAPTDEKKLLPQSSLFQAAARQDLSCRPCLWDVRSSSCERPICLEVDPSAVLEKVALLMGSEARCLRKPNPYPAFEQSAGGEE